MSKYNLIVMSFDGEYQEERPEFESIDKAWDYSNDLGSKWYFYPFHFVITNKTIVNAPGGFEWAERKRISTVARFFERCSKRKDAQGMDCDEFMFYMLDHLPRRWM